MRDLRMHVLHMREHAFRLALQVPKRRQEPCQSVSMSKGCIPARRLATDSPTRLSYIIHIFGASPILHNRWSLSSSQSVHAEWVRLSSPNNHNWRIIEALSLGCKGVPHGGISKCDELPTATNIWEHAYQLIISHLDMIVWNVGSTDHVID